MGLRQVVVSLSQRRNRLGGMLVRYRYRIDPTPGQRQALARAFGCARVVYNDAVAERRRAFQAGEPISDTEVQRRVITLAKQTPERAWLAGVASVVLVQACQDARRADRNWLDSSVQDAGWARFVRLVEEKAAQHGRRVVRIGRWVPTSQTCSACGRQDGPKPLGVRVWACPGCGAVHDRDVNAARNILVAAGLAETQNACGGHVRPGATLAVATEAGTHPGAA